MNKVFNVYSPIMSFLNTIGKLIILNLLWILCCIPIITIGPSTSAMYSVMFKVVNDTDGFLIKNFFIQFAKNFKQSLVIGIIFVIISILFIFDLRYAVSKEGIIGNLFVFVSVIGLFVAQVIFMYSFALQSMFKNTVKNYFKNSFLLLFYCPLKFVMLLAVWLGPYILTYNSYKVLKYSGFIWFVCGFALQFYFASKILLTVFKKVSIEESPEDSVEDTFETSVEEKDEN